MRSDWTGWIKDQPGRKDGWVGVERPDSAAPASPPDLALKRSKRTGCGWSCLLPNVLALCFARDMARLGVTFAPDY